MGPIITCVCGKKLMIREAPPWSVHKCSECGYVIPKQRIGAVQGPGGVELFPEDGVDYAIVEEREPLADRPKTRRKKRRKWAFLLHNEYESTNPGRIHINPLRYWMSYPFWPSLWAAICLYTVLQAITVSRVWLLMTFIFLVVKGVYWLFSWERFVHGGVCPGLVVSADEGLVAVFDDLGMHGRNHPCIKVVRQPLGRMTGGPAQNNTMLATVAIYYGNPDEKKRWDDFYPRVVNCVTNDEEAIERALQSIEREYWTILYEAIGRLPKPVRPGLYPLT